MKIDKKIVISKEGDVYVNLAKIQGARTNEIVQNQQQDMYPITRQSIDACKEFFREDLVKNDWQLMSLYWKGCHPNLRELFRPEEIDWLLIEDVKRNMGKSDKKYSVIEFVIRSGYEDEPKLVEDGKPLLSRPTAVHYAEIDHGGSLYDPDLVRQLFKIYCRFNLNYTDEYGFTHFHAACKFNCCTIPRARTGSQLFPTKTEHELGRSTATLGYRHSRIGRIADEKRRDPNLANQDGLTVLHIICKTDGNDIESAKMLFKISHEKNKPIDVNARDRLGRTPLHYALEQRHRKNFEFLLRSGADPNITDDEGSTPLHVIAKTSCDDDLMGKFFKMCDDNHLQVQVDVQDNKDRTPLQLAVMNFLPNSVDVLLDRGADLSSFVFPTEVYFAAIFNHRQIDNFCKFKIKIASDALAIVEHLEKRGYKLNRDSALIIMKTLDDYAIFKSGSLDTSSSDGELFAKAKTIIVKDNDPKLSLYDLIQVQPEEAQKLLTYADYSKLADSYEWWDIPGSHICAVHLSEMIPRGFCRRWALESFMEVTRNKYPISWYEKLIDSMRNEDLYLTCLKAKQLELTAIHNEVISVRSRDKYKEVQSLEHRPTTSEQYPSANVDTLDCKPAPALPPRRSWQQPTTSFAAINVLGVASGSGGGNGASQPPRPSSNSSDSALSDDFVDCARLQEQEKFAKAAAACRDATNRLLLSPSFQLTPPSYPAPPRPPSRNDYCSLIGSYTWLRSNCAAINDEFSIKAIHNIQYIRHMSASRQFAIRCDERTIETRTMYSHSRRSAHPRSVIYEHGFFIHFTQDNYLKIKRRLAFVQRRLPVARLTTTTTIANTKKRRRSREREQKSKRHEFTKEFSGSELLGYSRTTAVVAAAAATRWLRSGSCRHSRAARVDLASSLAVALSIYTTTKKYILIAYHIYMYVRYILFKNLHTQKCLIKIRVGMKLAVRGWEEAVAENPSGTLAHGSPLPRALPPRAGAVSAAATGWPLQPSLFDTAASTTNLQKNQQEQQQQASPGRPVAQQWASQHQQSHRFRNSNVLQKSSQEPRRFATTTATNAPRPPAVPQRNSEWHWLVAPTILAPPVPIVVSPSSSHLMSQNEPAARPPSTTPASSGVAAAAAATTTTTTTTNSTRQSPVLRHTRPLPPPRPEGPIAPAVALSTPSTPSPTPLRPASSFRMAGRAVPVRLESSSTPPPSRSSNPEQQQVTVSLQAPRPDGERVTNEYVETPFRAGQQQQTRSEELLDGTSLKKEGSGPVATHKALRGCLSKGSSQHERRGQAPRDAKSGNGLLLLTRNQRGGGGGGGGRPTASRDVEQLEQSSLRASQRLQASSAITKQPVSFTKEPLGGSRQDANSASLSIMCERCGKCRCESCREPPPLPSRWLCDNACLCSAETVLDYASCLCCVKGLFYHCADGGLGPGPGSDSLDESSELAGNCADEPCSCAGPRSAARWSCLGALALFLPCLLCYWPLRGCVALCEACYAKHATQGCRCDPRSLRPLQTNARHLSSSLAAAPISTVMSAADTARDPEKRLLEPSLPDL
ncbi:unnamed protein product [Trichogramma brassicae]|uniref:Uncharacterized protein n=1 Tax=Trichogramma brassicae TaxID=86971 RepID=A0A6H5IQ13_9HYME|nr:unnamed protein product [Trichogramma brassicae]